MEEGRRKSLYSSSGGDFLPDAGSGQHARAADTGEHDPAQGAGRALMGLPAGATARTGRRLRFAWVACGCLIPRRAQVALCVGCLRMLHPVTR